MLYFIFDRNARDPEACLVGVADKTPDGLHWTKYLCRHDLETFEDAEGLAVSATSLTGRIHIATDSGTHYAPRFDVIELPAVGEPCSYAFNGDATPDGHIARISGQNFRVITTTTGRRYFRRKLSGSWINEGTWSLVLGHINERNPSF